MLVVRGEALFAGVPEGPLQSWGALGKDWETSALGGRVLTQTRTSCVTLGKSLGALKAQFPHLKMRGWRSSLQNMHSRTTWEAFQPRFLGPVQSCQVLDLGVCVSEKLPGDLPGGQARMPPRSLSALSFQELEVAEPRYPGSGVPDLSKFYVKNYARASLVVQWLRIRLPVQGTWVRSLVWEGPACRGAPKPVCHNY